MILAEADFYQAQRHPCFGVQPRVAGHDTLFSPWVHDGRIVHWGLPVLTRSEAQAEARRMAEAMEPQQ